MDIKERAFDIEYFFVFKIMMKFACVWPYQRGINKFIGRSIILFMILVMMSIQHLRIYDEFRKDNHSWMVILECVTGNLYFALVILKYATVIVKMSKLQYLFEQITIDWEVIKEEGQLNILRKRARMGYILSLAYCAIITFGAATFTTAQTAIPMILDVIAPLNETRTRNLCYYPTELIDEKYFYHLMVQSIIAVFCTAIVSSGIDTVYMICIEHVLALFELIGYKLRKTCRLASKKSLESSTINLEDKKDIAEINSLIGDCVRTHLKALQFCELIRKAYDVCFFINNSVIMMCMALSIYLLHLNVAAGDITGSGRVGLFFVTIVMYQYFISIPGQKVQDMPYEVCDSIFYSGWYELPDRAKYTLEFMMRQCLQQCKMTAGPFMNMNLETASAVVKTGFSYFTVVSSMEL